MKATTVPARYLPDGVKTKPSRRAGLSLPPAHCDRCGDPLPEAKYHDCGEQLSMFDAPEGRA